MLFTLRHRQGNRGVNLSMIELKDPTGNPLLDQRLAEAVGKKYCDAQVNSLFINVTPAIVATDDVLSAAERKAIVEPPPPRKKDPKPSAPRPEPTEGEEETPKPKFDGNLDTLLGDDDEEQDADTESTDTDEQEQSDEEQTDATDEEGGDEEVEEVEEAPKPKKPRKRNR